MARKRVIYMSIDEDMINMIDKLATSKLGKLERSAVIRKLLDIGIKEALKDVDKFVEEVSNNV